MGRTIIVTFSTTVFSRNLKRQTARGHVTELCGHVWSSERGSLTPISRFSLLSENLLKSDLPELFYPEFLFMQRTNKKIIQTSPLTTCLDVIFSKRVKIGLFVVICKSNTAVVWKINIVKFHDFTAKPLNLAART